MARLQFLELLLTVAALQGVIMAILLLIERRNRKSNSYLAALLTCMSLANINLALEQSGWFYSGTMASLIHAFVPMVFIMPVGPLIYGYVRESISPGKTSENKAVHFYPVLLDVLPQVFALIYFIGIESSLITKAIPIGFYIDTYNIYVDIPRWLLITIYLLLTLRILKVTGSQTNAHKAKKGGEQPLQWMQQFTNFFLVFQALWLTYLLPYLLPATRNRLLEVVGWYPVYLPLSILIYIIGLQGYLKSRQHVRPDDNKIVDSGLSKEVIAVVTKVVIEAMDMHKLYRNPGLKLNDLATFTSYPPKTLSIVINQHLKTTFNGLVNRYRVEAFKQKAGLPESQAYTLLAIARECGFSSAASFQRIFKEVTGVSPSDYKNLI